MVVTDDGWGIAEELCRNLKQEDLMQSELDSNQKSATCQSKRKAIGLYSGLTQQILSILNKYAELNKSDVSGIIHLAALKLAGVEWDEDTYPSSQISLAAHGWFTLLKGLDSKLGKLENGIVVSVTTLDGRHGNVGELFNSVQASATGITKSYSFEQPHLRARALDLHPEIVLDASHAAEIIADDVFNTAGEVEIGIDRDAVDGL